ncbi:MAG TPA: YMGG-like glycine zipper-containing protein [Burkholderiales bacterium]|nr:YMGG-like glycine zipper-containing protein [Burkholderiales bacterium]
MRLRTTVVAVSAIALIASGCETMDGLIKSDDPCNPAIGALVGGVIGAVASDKKGRGAAIGAGVGALACIAFNAVSRQTRTAEQVETEYKQQHAGQLPPQEPVVQAYKVGLSPSSEIKSGNKVQLVSNMTVVSAAKQPVDEVKEVLTLVGPEGNRTAEKKANEKPGSGAYENTFNLSFPQNIAPGTYPIKTQLYVNGKPKETRTQNLKVVAQGDTLHLALVDSE